MSFGTDRSYRRFALRRAGLKSGMKVLDVATGTGLLAGAALELGAAPHEIIGLDPSRGMLRANRQKHSIALLQGVGEALPLRDEMFDFVLMGYALRHVADLTALFAEFHRVLKKSGQVLVLEITRPGSRLGCAVMRLYMRRVVPAVIRLRGYGPDVGKLMEYYWATIEHCVPPQRILSALGAAGFGEVRCRTSMHIFSEYEARKLSADQSATSR